LHVRRPREKLGTHVVVEEQIRVDASVITVDNRQNPRSRPAP
jgi:hypothetical protein